MDFLSLFKAHFLDCQVGVSAGAILAVVLHTSLSHQLRVNLGDNRVLLKDRRDVLCSGA